MKRRNDASPPAPAPPEAAALEASDGAWFVLSFPLDGAADIALTSSESAVAALILAGRTNAEIAAVRGTSARTVANQVASLFKKLGVRSRLELVAFAPLLRAPKK